MTTSMEFEGRNLDKAVEKACSKLNIPRDRLIYDVISQGSTGIFGLAVTKRAKIRVQFRAEAARDSEAGDFEPETTTYQSEEHSSKSAETPAAETGVEVQGFARDPVDVGGEVLKRIVDAIASDTEIAVKRTAEEVWFNISSSNPSILIGKRGQTLEAIQAIVEKVVNRHNGSRVRVEVDIEGYLNSRKENLEKLALRLADKSKRIRKPVSMGQMSAHDRRIIHMVLKDVPGVRTLSVGDGFFKKLMILPRKDQGERDLSQ
jgi:spoIIIJ-associated protein